jgi:hypothetical protein
MRVCTVLAAAVVAAAAMLMSGVGSARAQDAAPGVIAGSGSNPDQAGRPLDASTMGILATTPSRIASSRREMNRGRPTTWASRPTPSQLHTFAERSLRRGGFQCTIAEVALVGEFTDNTLIVEVACQENGGLVIADSDPVQFSDCLDLVNTTGAIGPCRIPKNVALVSASRP